MRFFVTALMLVALAGSAFAGNVAISSATSFCAAGSPCDFGVHPATNLIDGNTATKWIAPDSAVNPYVLLDLGSLKTIDSITVTGEGSTGLHLDFSVYVGTSPLSHGAPGTLVGSFSEIGTGDPLSLWTATSAVSTSSAIRYILYDVTGSYNSTTKTNYDYAYAGEITADGVPEPGTVGLIGAGLLALGFTLRSRKK